MTADGIPAAGAETDKMVEAAARAARGTVADLASVPDERLDDALRAMAGQLGRQADAVLAANEADMQAARADGIAGALLDRLGWTRPGLTPSPASSGRWPTSRPSRPGGRSGNWTAGSGWKNSAGPWA